MKISSQSIYHHPWFVKTGEADIYDVHGILSVPFTFGEEGTHQANTETFDRFNVQNKHATLHKYSLQILCRIAQDATQGTPNIVGLSRQDKRYHRTFAALWRNRNGKPKIKGDDELIKKYYRDDLQYCPLHADLWARLVHMHSTGEFRDWIRQFEEARAGNGNVQVVREGEAEEATDAQVRAEQTQRKSRKKPDYIAEWFKRKLLCEFVQVDEYEGVVSALETEPILEDRIVAAFITFPKGRNTPIFNRFAMPTAEESAQGVLDPEHVLRILHQADGGAAEDNATEDLEIAGAAFILFIKDQNFNPGLTVAHMIEAQEKRSIHVTRAQGNAMRSYSGQSRFHEPYPELLFMDDHVVFHLSRQCWMMLMDFHNNSSRFTRRNNFISPLHLTLGRHRVNPSHPEHIFTLERTLATLSNAGCNRDRLNIFQWLIHRECCQDEDEDECQYDIVRPLHFRLQYRSHTYIYPQATVFWGKANAKGLSEQYFPHIKESFDPQNYVLTPLDPMEIDEEDDDQNVDVTALAPYEAAHNVFDRDLVHHGSLRKVIVEISPLQRQTNIHWRTAVHDEHKAIDDEIRKTLQPPHSGMRWDSPQYQAFAKAKTDFRSFVMTKWLQFFYPNDKVISKAMNEIYTWFYNEYDKKGVGFLMHQSIPSMDVLANFHAFVGQVIRNDVQIVVYVNAFLVMNNAALDVYRQKSKAKMHPAFFNFGPGRSGKSYVSQAAIIHYLLANLEKHESSKRAKNVDTHIEDVAIYQDELPTYLVKLEDAKKHPEKVEEFKRSRSDNQYIYEVFEDVVTSNGNKKRTARIIVTKTDTVLVGNTNCPPNNGDEAAASRVLSKIWPHHRDDVAHTINIDAGHGEADRAALKDIKKMFYTHQALVAMASIGQDIFALPPVTMDVFFLLSEKMTKYLNKSGTIEIDIRMLINMSKIARVLTIKEAILKLWYVPGAPYLGQKFHPRQLLDLGPHLWCSKQCTLLTWSLCSEYLFDSTIQYVINSAFALANISPLRPEGYKHDQPEILNNQSDGYKVQWRTTSYYDKELTEMVEEVDFNYIQINGTLRDFATLVNKQSGNILDVPTICAQVKNLTKQTITVVPWKKMEQSKYDGTMRNWLSRVRREGRQAAGPLFDFSPNAPPGICPQREQRERIIAAAHIRYNDSPCVCIAVHASATCAQTFIEDAFMQCVNARTRPQSFITGFQIDDHPGIYSKLYLSQEVIDHYSGVDMIGDEDPEDDGTIIPDFTMPNAGYMTELAVWLLRSFKMDPVDVFGEGGYDVTESERQHPLIVIDKDLDYWCFERHWYVNGYLGDPKASLAHPDNNAWSIENAVENDPRVRAELERIPLDVRKEQAKYPESYKRQEQEARDRQRAIEKRDLLYQKRKRRMPTEQIRSIKPKGLRSENRGPREELLLQLEQ